MRPRPLMSPAADVWEIIADLRQVGGRISPSALRTRQVEPVLLTRERVRVPSVGRDEHVRAAVRVEVGEQDLPRMHGQKGVDGKEIPGAGEKCPSPSPRNTRPGCGVQHVAPPSGYQAPSTIRS